LVLLKKINIICYNFKVTNIHTDTCVYYVAKFY